MKAPKITIGIVCLLVIITFGFSGIEEFHIDKWIYGFICSNILIALWWSSQPIRLFMSMVGIGMFASVMAGFIPPGTDITRSFFNGFSYGCLTGILLALRIYWPNSARYASMAAEYDGYMKLSAWFDKRAK